VSGAGSTKVGAEEQRELRFFGCRSLELNQRKVETTSYSLSGTAPAQPERRTGERYLSLLRVGALLLDGRRELCLIRNVSSGGMMIRPYSPIPVGKPVSIELKQGAMVTGVAQWAEGDLVGISFDQPIDVVDLLAASAGESKPRMPRIEIDFTTYVREDAVIHRTRAVNISQGGIRVRTEADLTIDAGVTISLAGLAPIGGTVKWQDADEYGLGFNYVLPIAELMRFLRERQSGSRRAG
jgi:hypothetical protein